MPERLFTPEQIKADGGNRVAKTAGQAGVASAAVTLGAAFLRWRGWLHGELDIIGAGAWITILSAVAAAGTNWGRLRGKG